MNGNAIERRRPLAAAELVAAFRPVEPRTVVPRSGTEFSWDTEDLRVARAGEESALSLPAEIVEDLYRLVVKGDSYAQVLHETTDRDLLRQLVHELAFQGYVEDSDTLGRGLVSGFNVVARIADAIRAAQTSPDGLVTERIADGRLARSDVKAWLEDQFLFTASAVEHIAPVLERATTPSERNAWVSFCTEESWHWKIFRKIFADLETSFEQARRSHGEFGARRLTAHMRALAERSQYEYAAAALVIEEPCDEKDLLDDPVYRALHLSYGVRLDSIRPLYWHSRENETKGHRDMMAAVLASRAVYSPAEIEGLIEIAAQTVSILARNAARPTG